MALTNAGSATESAEDVRSLAEEWISFAEADSKEAGLGARIPLSRGPEIAGGRPWIRHAPMRGRSAARDERKTAARARIGVR